MTPIETLALTAAAKAACAKVGSALFTKAMGAAWDKAFKKDALEPVYRKWRKSFQNPEGDGLNAVFEEYFAMPRVKDELAKLGRDQYSKIKFDILADELKRCCQWGQCAPPEGNLHDEINGWVLELKAILEDKSLTPKATPRDMRSAEAAIENDSIGREKYLDWAVRQNSAIQLSGMPLFKDQRVDMAGVFVMPRVLPRGDGLMERVQEKEPKPIASARLFGALNAVQRIVILGGPGSGKTTLLKALALAFVKPDQFAWSKTFPALLPVFYRVRDLEKDLENHGNVWDCIQHRCSRSMNATLPLGFFTRQADAIFLFDGLDETSSPGKRNDIMALLDSFAATIPAESRVVITSRPHDYRQGFDAKTYKHYDLCEFDDGEIRTFIQHWQSIHEPDAALAKEKGENLWKALKARADILPLARNALLLTMIVRVHFGQSALPDSRLGLYEKCTETLLEHWATDKELPPSPIDATAKHKLLQRLAYEMQGEAETLSSDMTLQISRPDLAERLGGYLKEEGRPYVDDLVDKVIRRLHERDAILVQYGADARGQDLFGFVHRSFQEYFAGCFMARELEDEEFHKHLFERRDGWDETLYLAVALLKDKQRRKTLLELVKAGQAEFAVECLRAAVPEELWLRKLVQFLARHTWGGRQYADLTAADCAETCCGRGETLAVLQAMFKPENREGRSLAAAVELAEELARRGNAAARKLVEEFLNEGRKIEAEMVEVAGGRFLYGRDQQSVTLPTFRMDRYLVTNGDYERMIPGHGKLRDRYSDTDRQPVTWVNWFEAKLYARWRGCRLPTEEEWEKAASWDAAREEKRAYPWGEAFDKDKCRTYESSLFKTSPVGAYQSGRSAYGCEDMAGNVWEWTESLYGEGGTTIVLRGGSFNGNGDNAACVFRYYVNPQNRNNNAGMRCART